MGLAIRLNIRGIILLAAVLTTARTACAQSSRISIDAIDDLSFGTVPTSTSVTFTPSNPGAGRSVCRLRPEGKTPGTVSFLFTLPGALTSEGNSLPISFGINSAAYNTTNTFSGSTSFSPSQGLSGIQVSPGEFSEIYFWLGGAISPVMGQEAGTYKGVILITGTMISGDGKSVTTTETLEISVKILPTLYLSATGSLNFGDIVAGGATPSLSPQTNPSAPIFIAAGAPDKRIHVSYHLTMPLMDGRGHALQFQPKLYGSDNQMNQTSSTPVAPESSITLGGGQIGYYYFWLGGVLSSVPKKLPSGDYTGTFTLTVCY